MQSSPRGPIVLAVAALLAAGCAILNPPPPLFPKSHPVEQFDFEGDPLNQLPIGLEPRPTNRWAVADSPTAVSGSQVLVRHGDDPSVLSIGGSDRGERTGGEVSLRVILGPSGAGIACESGGSAGYVLSVEPEEHRIALYRRDDQGNAALVEAEPASVEKGKWVRLGILCERDRIVGYLDGKPLIEQRRPIGTSRLALYVDAGVTAQFDDLRYTAQAVAER